MAVATPSVTEICLAAREASRRLAVMGSGAKDAALGRVADAPVPPVEASNVRTPAASPASRTR